MNQQDLITQAEQHLSAKLRSIYTPEPTRMTTTAELKVPTAIQQLTGVERLTQTRSGMVTIHYTNGSVRRGLYPHQLDERVDALTVVDYIVNGGDD